MDFNTLENSMSADIRKQYDQRHGGPFDRGSADSWYGRPKIPHYYMDGSGTSLEVTLENMTKDEIAAYDAGYDWNEQYGGKKDYD